MLLDEQGAILTCSMRAPTRRNSPSRDPQGSLRGTFRVLRGGSWMERPLELWAGYRGWDETTYWGPTLGFRYANDAP